MAGGGGAFDADGDVVVARNGASRGVREWGSGRARAVSVVEGRGGGARARRARAASGRRRGGSARSRSRMWVWGNISRARWNGLGS